MARILTTGFILLLMLTGCGEEVNPVIGKWRGEITKEQREGLEIPKGGTDGILVAAFTKSTAVLNGKTYRVEHKKNQETYYVNVIGTNRTMAINFTDPNTIKLGSPHLFKTEIIDLFLSRTPVAPSP
jgi:hypothetical protein